MAEPLILGVSSSHNGSACIIRGDRVLVAVQEERLSRVKRHRVHAGVPFLALRYCLDAAGVGPADLDLIVCSVQGHARSPRHDITLNRMLRPAARHVPWLEVSHHRGHAVSAFVTSGFTSAAVLVVDGLGSPVEDLDAGERATILRDHGDRAWESLSFFAADGSSIRPVEKQVTPHSGPVRGRARLDQPDWNLLHSGTLGQLYAAVAQQIFGDRQAAGKVMGLAPFGRPTIPIEEFLQVRDGEVVFNDRAPRRFPMKERWPAHREAYADLACSVQAALEHAILALAIRLRSMTGETRLCYAGGVALNSVANERIIREAGFDEVHVVPPAEDSGVSIGAAFQGLHHLTGRFVSRALRRDSFGVPYTGDDVETAMETLPVSRVTPSGDLLDDAADRLARGEIGGWFQGGSELGPRALGQRSILCDPRHPDAKARLNARVKRREMFRPFAPAMPLEEVDTWFDVEPGRRESRFMLRVMTFRPSMASRVPAVVHVDGTGRLQTLSPDDGRLFDLAKRLGDRTGIPVLLNTSFNVAGEPIVETPEDALWTLLEVDLDFCVLQDTIVTRRKDYDSLLSLVPHLVASSFTIQVAAEDIGVRGDPEVAFFDVRTRWGPAVQRVDGRGLQIALEVDGERNGHDIGRGLLDRSVELSDDALIQALARLRRLGVIDLRLDSRSMA